MRPFSTWLSIGLLAAAALCCSAPQAQEPPAHRIADLFIRYLQSDQQLKAYASFYEGDSLPVARPLTIEGGVRFIGKPMEKRELSEYGIRYTAARTGNYRDQFGFTFPREDGHLQEYVLAMTPIDSFAFQAPPSKTLGATLFIENGKLQAGESLVLFFSGPDNKAYTIDITGPTASASHSLNAGQLADLPTGSLQLYLVKKKIVVEESQEVTVLKAIEYYTRAIDVWLEP